MAHGQPSTASSDERLTMVCYARPASRMAALLLVVFLVFGRSAGHFLDSAALFVAIAVAVAVAAVAAAVAFTMFLSVRRRRAAAGGCVSCQLRCQHAMTEQPRRLLLVSRVDRGAAGGSRGADSAAGAAAFAAPAAPRWPDRPAIRSGVASRPVAARPVALLPTASQPAVASHAIGRERTGSVVLPAFSRRTSSGMARMASPSPSIETAWPPRNTRDRTVRAWLPVSQAGRRRGRLAA